LELAGGTLAGFLIACLPFRFRIPKRAIAATLVVLVCAGALWGLGAALRFSRELPSGDVARVAGDGTGAQGTFSGQLYNGTSDWTIREVTLRIVQHQRQDPIPADFFDSAPKRAPDALDNLLDQLPPASTLNQPIKPPPGFTLDPPANPDSEKGWVIDEPAKPDRGKGRKVLDDPPKLPVPAPPPTLTVKDYRIDGLWIGPLQTRPIQLEFLSPRNLEFDCWQILAAKGCKNYW
jgi:hypothetical protein